ncbi:transcriptional regulator [Terrilactibacillus sp. BCM23-1]|uniref:Transcriptional regulator n=1 Tax=Terrilactibacillus tamarindi TaxID=2599694 RepID=A0A6N8CPH9_9BACI|nr:transcriptional regulator [Terrilactibacillus tamarindi]MTT32032.1 transcriptional regulator [Terrilactibacillus tamarindi]
MRLRSYRNLKKSLFERKAEIEKSLNINEEFGTEIAFADDNASGELSQYDNHPADSGTQLYEREKDITLKRLARRELNEIQHALDKLENGTYGIDEKTGKKIPYARLKALPTARTAVDLSAKQAVHSDIRPVDESFLLENAESTLGDKLDYDEENAYDIVASYNDIDMVYDDSSIIDSSNDQVGYVENIEAVLATGIDGYHGDEEVQFLRNVQYDKEMKRDHGYFTEDLDVDDEDLGYDE